MNRFGIGVSIVVAALLAPIPRAHAAPGDLDPSFSDDGKLTHDVGGDVDVAVAVLPYPGGRIVTVGNAHVDDRRLVVVARYEDDGELDRSFGTDGVVTFRAGDDAIATDALVDGDKVVVVGAADRAAFIARRNSDGAADEAFATGGLVVRRFGEWDYASFSAVTRLPSGKYVAAGTTASWDHRSRARFLLARWNTDGSLDTSRDGDPSDHFSFNGWTTAGSGGIRDLGDLGDLAAQPDGRIVAVGYRGHAETEDFVVTRYGRSGRVDEGFGKDGTRTVDFGDFDRAGAVIATGDRILVGGSTGKYFEEEEATDDDWALAALRLDGSLDRSFHDDGRRRLQMGAYWEGLIDLTLQPDGRIVAAGYTNDHPFTDATEMCVVRLHASGRRDRSFGRRGVVTVEFSDELDDASVAVSVALDAGGRILLAGRSGSQDSEPSTWDMAVARVEP